MVTHFQYLILVEKISHNGAYLYLSKKYLKQYSKKHNAHNAYEQRLTKIKFHLKELSYQSGLHEVH